MYSIKKIFPILFISLIILSSFTIDKRTEKKLKKDIKSGKMNGEEMKYRNDISAISGATISVKSMVSSIERASEFIFSNKEKIYE